MKAACLSLVGDENCLVDIKVQNEACFERKRLIPKIMARRGNKPACSSGCITLEYLADTTCRVDRNTLHAIPIFRVFHTSREADLHVAYVAACNHCMHITAQHASSGTGRHEMDILPHMKQHR